MSTMAKPRHKSKWTPKKLRQHREAFGWSVEYAAEKIGVAPRTWLYWELPKQERGPSLSHEKLIDLLFDGKL